MRRLLVLVICIELVLACLSGSDPPEPECPAEPILPALYEDPMA